MSENEETAAPASSSIVELPFTRDAADRRARYYSQLGAVRALHADEVKRINALMADVNKASRLAEGALDEQLAAQNEQFRSELSAAIDTALPAPLAKWRESGLRADALAFGDVVLVLAKRQSEEIGDATGNSELVKGLCRAFGENESSFAQQAQKLINASALQSSQGRLVFLERELVTAEEIANAKYYKR